MDDAREIWRQKLMHLQTERAIASDAARIFTLDQQIKEANENIAELDLPVELPADNTIGNGVARRRALFRRSVGAVFVIALFLGALYVMSGGVKPEKLSTNEFNRRLADHRNGLWDTISENYYPAAPSKKTREIQVAMVQAALAKMNDHKRFADTTNQITKLIDLGEISSSIEGFDGPGPRDISINAWLNELEIKPLAITIDGVEHEESMLWWLIYASVRESLSEPSVRIAINAARMGQLTPEQFVEFLASKAGTQTRKILNTQATNSMHAQIKKIDPMLRAHYAKWRSNPNSYVHAELISQLDETTRKLVTKKLDATSTDLESKK